MAYYRRQRSYTGSSGYSKYYRRGERRAYPRAKYGKKASGKRYLSSYKKKSTMARSSSALSARRLNEKLEKLTLQNMGDPCKYVVHGVVPGLASLPVHPESGAHYFAIPASEIFLAACALQGSTSLYVTGISLEMDLFHVSPMDFFTTCVKMPAGSVDKIEIDAANGKFALGSLVLDTKHVGRLWSVDNPYVVSVSNAAYKESARDGSLFSAPMKPGLCPSGNYSFNDSKRAASHTGRVSVPLARKGDQRGSAMDAYVRDSMRVYWEFNKKLRVCSAGASEPDLIGDRYTILCGVRPQVDKVLNHKDPEAKFAVAAYFENVRVTVHARHRT